MFVNVQKIIIQKSPFRKRPHCSKCESTSADYMLTLMGKVMCRCHCEWVEASVLLIRILLKSAVKDSPDFD